MKTQILLLISLGINIAWLSQNLLKPQTPTQASKALSEEFYDELCPTVIYNRDESVEVGFDDNGLAKKGKRNYENCINPEAKKPRMILHYIKKCLPLFKEYIPRVKKDNRKLVKKIPNYVPKFQESGTVVDYPYSRVKWKDLYKTPLRTVNLINKLQYYSRNRGIFSRIFCGFIIYLFLGF